MFVVSERFRWWSRGTAHRRFPTGGVCLDMEASGTGGTRFYEDGCAVAKGLSDRPSTQRADGIRSHQNASRSVKRMGTGISETPDNGIVT